MQHNERFERLGHVEPEDLAVYAVDGDPPDASARAHLDVCIECLAEYESLSRTVALARTAALQGAGFEADVPADELVPPPAVWAGIHAELALEAELATDPFSKPASIAAAAPGSDDAAPVDELAQRRDRRALRPRRGIRWAPVAAAAAVLGVLGGVAIGVAVARPGTAPMTVLASAQLDAFPGWDATGEAFVEKDDESGARTVVVDLDAPAASGEVREVWLIRSDASGLVSLGLLDGSSGRFTVPESIDLADYRLVDVSAEPVDGDPAHSGDSIVRGELN